MRTHTDPPNDTFTNCGQNALWGQLVKPVLKPCIVLDRRVCSQGWLRRAGCMYMPVWLSNNESQGMHASRYLPRLPKPVSHTHTRSLSGSCLAHHFSWIFNSTCPGTKLFAVSQIPPLFLCMPEPVPPPLSLLPCVPSSGAPYVWVLVVQCGMWWGGGRQAGLKGGAQLFPHTASTPHWSVAHLAIWGGKAKDAEKWNYGHSVDTCTHCYWIEATLGAY